MSIFGEVKAELTEVEADGAQLLEDIKKTIAERVEELEKASSILQADLKAFISKAETFIKKIENELKL